MPLWCLLIASSAGGQTRKGLGRRCLNLYPRSPGRDLSLLGADDQEPARYGEPLCCLPCPRPQQGLTLTSVKSAVIHGWEGIAPGDGCSGRGRSAAVTDWRPLPRAAPSRCFCLTWLGGPGWGGYGRVPRSGDCHGVVVLVQCECPRDLVG